MNELLKKDAWDKSYDRKENYVFYPEDHVIRFVSRYIKKRTGVDDFTTIRPYKNGLDLCCGIGRHMVFLDDYGFDVEGLELSDSAVKYAKTWFQKTGRDHLIPHIQIGSAAELPYKNEQFDFVVCCSALDSMHSSVAQKALDEVHRVLKKSGLFFFDLIASDTRNQTANDMVVESGHEQGTIQSYYDDIRIENLIRGQFHILEHFVLHTEYKTSKNSNSRNYVILEKVDKTR